MGSFRRKLIDPFIMPVVIIAIIWFSLMGLGKVYLAVFEEDKGVDRIDRTELWIGIVILVGIMGLMAFLASRPAGTMGPLDEDVTVGSRPFFDQSLPKVEENVRAGALGTVEDVKPGYRLYASNGEMGTVLGTMPGGVDYGKRFSGFIHAEGVRGVSDELWIPFEAVSAVYPESQAAFLAIKGDETESFGWNTPPEFVSRGPAKHMTAEEKAKDPTRYPKKY